MMNFNYRQRYVLLLPAVLAGAALLLLLGTAGATQPDHCQVPGHYGTIQSAVDDDACAVIEMAAGTFHESATISRTVTLKGQGASLSIIDGENVQGELLNIQAGALVTVTGLTFQQGGAHDMFPRGAIHLVDADLYIADSRIINSITSGIYSYRSNLTSHRCYFEGNGAGAVHHDASTTEARLWIGDSSFVGNTAYNGGAVYNGNGRALLSGLTLLDNSANSGGGGAIYNGGSMTITDSLIEGNTTNVYPGGGGIKHDGKTLIISETVLRANQGGGGALSLHGRGDLLIEDSLISGNKAPGGSGGGIVIDHFYRGTATIRNSTLVDNEASGGGGISVSDMEPEGRLIISDSTLTGNTAVGWGGAIQARDGAIFFSNVTIAQNMAREGGGIQVESGAQVEVVNSIIAHNIGGGDCAGSTIVSLGHNIASDGSCALAATGDQPNTNPRIDPLAGNGGLTPTRALRDGSPAIDAGDDDACSVRDQRGALRPFDGGSGQARCDIGAFEFASPPPPRAAFVARPVLVEPGRPVQFWDVSEGAVATQLWEFGDGVTSTLISPSHAYTQTGSYSVTLALDSAIGADTVTYPDYIRVIDRVYRQSLPFVSQPPLPPAPPAPSLWARTFAADGNDVISALVETAAGDFVVAGRSGSSAHSGWIAKLDKEGAILWQRNYVGVYRFGDLKLTQDGGLIAVGVSGNAASAEGIVLRLRSDGTLLWARAVNDTYSIYSVDTTTGGGFILSGFRNYGGPWVLKLKADGRVAWWRLYQGWGILRALQVTGDGGAIVAGQLYTSGEDAGFVMKLNGDGTTAWQMAYEGKGWGEDGAIIHSIWPTSDGGYVAAGYWEELGWILKLTSTGEVSWQKTYEDDRHSSIEFSSVLESSDGDYVAVGSRGGSGGNSSGVVVKVDPAGDALWYKRYAGGDLRAGIPSRFGGYVVAGKSNADDAWILRLDESGEMGADCYLIDNAYPEVVTRDNAVANLSEPAITPTEDIAKAPVSVVAASLAAGQVCPAR